MKELTRDMKAALLYLQFYQALESQPSDYNEIMFILNHSDIINRLVEMDYPDPTTVAYDDDGCPVIEWQSSRERILATEKLGYSIVVNNLFSCIDFYEAIDFNPNYFN